MQKNVTTTIFVSLLSAGAGFLAGYLINKKKFNKQLDKEMQVMRQKLEENKKWLNSFYGHKDSNMQEPNIDEPTTTKVVGKDANKEPNKIDMDKVKPDFNYSSISKQYKSDADLQIDKQASAKNKTKPKIDRFGSFVVITQQEFSNSNSGYLSVAYEYEKDAFIEQDGQEKYRPDFIHFTSEIKDIIKSKIHEHRPVVGNYFYLTDVRNEIDYEIEILE